MLNQFSRTELLLGPDAMAYLAQCRVAVFGVGGVGGYAVEALAREVKDLTDGYGIPPVTEEKTGNPVKRLYKKITCKAVRCATVPLSSSVTEANLRFKTALEKALAVVEYQQREIEELKDRIWNLER